MTRAANQSIVRQINQRMVLDAIVKYGPISRADLSRMLFMSKPTSSSNINQLIELQVIREVERADRHTRNGRQPILVELNNEHRYICAIELNYQDPIFTILNLAGDILDEQILKVTDWASIESPRVIEDMLYANGISLDTLFCIGISSPGFFTEEGTLYDIHEKHKSRLWEDIASRLPLKFGIPAFIKNDANAGAFGEFLFGAGENNNDLLYICCGLGLGAGVILNGNLYESTKCLERSISIFTDKQRLGLGETIEDSICIAGFLERLRTKLISGQSSVLSSVPLGELSFSDVVDAYRKNDSLTIEEIKDIAKEIACITMSLSGFLGIENVIFGGDYLVFKDTILPIVSDVFKSYSHVCEIHAAKLEQHAGIYGIFGIARDRLFSKICNR